jgi:hypothetical protein
MRKCPKLWMWMAAAGMSACAMDGYVDEEEDGVEVASHSFELGLDIDIDDLPSTPGETLDPRVFQIDPFAVQLERFTFTFEQQGPTDDIAIVFKNTGGVAIPKLADVQVTIESASQPDVPTTSWTGKIYGAGTQVSRNDTIGLGEEGVLYLFGATVGAVRECSSWRFTLNFIAQGFTSTATLPGPCPIRWSQSISPQRLGFEPDPILLGKSLEDIINSREQVRDEGVCSHCHNRGNGNGGYSPPVSPDSVSSFEADTQIKIHQDQTSWSTPGTDRLGHSMLTWAERFINNTNKPEGMKQVLRKWIADGSPR